MTDALDTQLSNTLDQLFVHLKKWSDIWRLPALPQQVTIRFSNRLLYALGRCNSRTGAITLSGVLLQEENRSLLFETLCHEAAHAAAFRLNGRFIKPHGKEWKTLMQAAGYQPKVRVRMELVHGLPERWQSTQRRYEYLCPACGVSHFRRNKNPRLRCRKCYEAGKPGSLVIRKTGG